MNTLLTNLKTALKGTYYAFDFAKYAHPYLAEAQYRFNRRFQSRHLGAPVACRLPHWTSAGRAKREALATHWNGKFLLALLTETSKPGHYAHCYFYGRLAPHPKVRDLLVVEVGSLDHLAFTVRKRMSI